MSQTRRDKKEEKKNSWWLFSLGLYLIVQSCNFLLTSC